MTIKRLFIIILTIFLLVGIGKAESKSIEDRTQTVEELIERDSLVILKTLLEYLAWSRDLGAAEAAKNCPCAEVTIMDVPVLQDSTVPMLNIDWSGCLEEEEKK